MAEKADVRKDGKKEDDDKRDGKRADKGKDDEGRKVDREERKDGKPDKDDDKKAKQKEVISKLAEDEAKKSAESGAPAAVGRRRRISVSEFVGQYVHLGKEFREGLPFLLATLVFSGFAFVMLAKTGISFSDLFDFGRVSNNVGKIFSISFILFFILYGFAMGIAAYFGYVLRASKVTIALSLLLIFIPIGFASWFTPNFAIAFVGLGFSVILAALFGSLIERLEWGQIYSALGRALLVMAILAVLFTFVKVNSQKDEYFALFITNIASLTPQLQGQIQGSLGDAIERIELSGEDVAELVKEDQPTKYVDRESVRALVKLQYPSFRDANVNSFQNADRQYARDSIPAAYDSLDTSTKEKLVDDTFKYLSDGSTSKITTGALTQLWPKLRTKLAENVKAAAPRAPSETEIGEITKKLSDIQFFKTFYNYFEIIISLLMLTILSTLNMVLRLLASGVCFGITRLL